MDVAGEKNRIVSTTLDQIPLTDGEFALIRQLVYSKFGINLTEQKRSLVVGRLSKVLKENGLNSFRDYYDHVISDKTGTFLSQLIDRISTNHTFFYRESDHFEYLSDVILPEYANKAKNGGRKVLRIWCSASSSGEEPYTLAMVLYDFFKDELQSWDIGILATDISNEILNIARAGIYPEENASLLPKTLQQNYFDKHSSSNWTIKNCIKDIVLFRRLNLIQNEYPFKGKFQIIFSRNVMIYFDEQTRAGLIKRYYRYLEPAGFLFLGHSESLGRNNNLFRYIRPAVYKKEPIP